jgi:hypothetical protein
VSVGRYKNLWEMRQPGFTGERQIFKCTECGAETDATGGWNGEPDRHLCRSGCRCNSKLTIVRTSDFGRNLEQVRFDGIDVPMGPGENPVAAALTAYATNWDRVFGKQGCN